MFKIHGQTLAFPGAEGFGKYTVGGRGGTVIEVTNLNDDGPGSLREAIKASGPRTVIFRVSGTIDLKSTLKIRNDFITIAGQTAPGDGICIKNYPLDIGADEVIVRYMRCRLGDQSDSDDDAFNVFYSKNVVIDHVSASWSIDETFSLYTGIENVTVQWCIMSESLRNSHHEKGEHGYGGIWGGNHVTYHHNLLAHHTSRTPRWDRQVEYMDFRNNVIYNWGFNSCYGGEGGATGPSLINMVANYYKPGPGTSSGEKRYRVANPSTNENGYGLWYIAENEVEGYPQVAEDNWLYGVQGITQATKDQIRVNVPFDFMPIEQDTPHEAYLKVLAQAGALLPKRDLIDSRIVWETENGTALYGGTYGAGTGMIDSQDEVGGWPELFSTPYLTDTDHDGMPDEWEIANGLNHEDPEDRNGDFNSDGYTNLEDYINNIIQTDSEYLTPPTELSAVLVGTNSIQLNWQDNSTNETGIRIQRKSSGDFETVAELDSNSISYLDEGLEDYTLYQYRVSVFNDSLISAYSNITEVRTSSQAAPPDAAIQVYPKNSSNFASLKLALRWNSGLSTETHDVYFGTTNPPPFLENVVDTFYTVGPLDQSKKYYWRIDEINEHGTTVGSVNSFTTKYNLPNMRVAYWKLDEATGTEILDAGGFVNHGSMVGMSEYPWVSGINDDAIQFDGINDRIVIENNGLLDFSTESFSISIFAKVDQFSDGSKYLICKGSFVNDPITGTNGSWYGIELKGNELRFAYDDDVHKSYLAVTGAEDLLGNQWNHIVAVRDVENLKMRLYINGRLAGEADDVSGDISNIQFVLLGNSYSLATPFSGVLDEIKMYNYALTGTEILNLTSEFLTDTEDDIIPVAYLLSVANYPNPFNPTTTIIFSLPQSSFVKLDVFDQLGRLVQTLVDDKKDAGEYSVSFDASNLSSGIYFYRLITPNKVISNKMLLIK